jgi:hypothetical protein
MNTQFFSHRPPSKITLLSDPLPPSLRVRHHRKTFHWPAYRNSPKEANGLRTVRTLGLQA